MKSIVLEGPEGLGQVQVADRPKPEAAPGQVLVKVKAAGLNHLDLWLIQGKPAPPSYPHVLGSDACGILERAAEGFRIQAGKRVLVNPGRSCGICGACRAGEESLCQEFKILGEQVPGVFSEYLVLPQENIEEAPEHLTDEEAGVFSLTMLTAWRMLKTRARVQMGETLLLTGIGGGVATSALVLGKAMGLRILVTSRSEEKLERAKVLGAEAGVFHGTGDFSRWVREQTGKRGVDVVLDSSGKATFEAAVKSLARGGRYVSCGATGGPAPDAQLSRLFWNQLSYLGSTMGSRGEFRDLIAFVSANKIRPVVDSVFEMGDSRAGLERLGQGLQFGKIGLMMG